MSSIIRTHSKDPLTALASNREEFLRLCHEHMEFHAVLWKRPQLISESQRMYDNMFVIRSHLTFLRSHLKELNDRLELIKQAHASLDPETMDPHNLFRNIPVVRDDFLLANEIIPFDQGNHSIGSMDMYHKKDNPHVAETGSDKPHFDDTPTIYFQYAGAQLRIHHDPYNLKQSWKVPNGSALLIRPECMHARAPREDIVQEGRLAMNYFA